MSLFAVAMTKKAIYIFVKEEDDDNVDEGGGSEGDPMEV